MQDHRPMISTPLTAYQWCRDLGLSHQLALEITRNRATFEYYAETVRHIFLLVNVTE